MKCWILLMLTVCLLCGCAQEPVPTTAPTTTAPAETTAPTSAPETVPETTASPDPLEVFLDAMTAEELVGQLLLARCPDADALVDIQKYHLGGYLLFGRDIAGQTPESLKSTLAGYQSAAAIPMLIAVDEEGGTVCRVSSSPAFRESRFPSPRSLYQTGQLNAIREAEEEKIALLSWLGINVNLAPVCDISTDPNAFMYSRSLGQSPEVTGDFVRMMVSMGQKNRFGMVLKHFPGYGNNSDTHFGIAVDSRSLEELEAVDLVPFSAGISADCDAILVSHTVVQALDPYRPATLSPTVLTYLRRTMGFQGVIVTDDLAMGAITDGYGSGEAAVQAIRAGNDLLCVSDYQTAYQAILEALQEGRISQSRLEASVRRILLWKADLGLISF